MLYRDDAPWVDILPTTQLLCGAGLDRDDRVYGWIDIDIGIGIGIGMYIIIYIITYINIHISSSITISIGIYIRIYTWVETIT